MRRIVGICIGVIMLFVLAAPAQAISSSSAKRAVKKAVKKRYDVPLNIGVRCHGGKCKVAFRQGLSSCKDNSVKVTSRRRVKNMSPDCVADQVGPTLPDVPPVTDGPPPPPAGPPPPPASGSASTTSFKYTNEKQALNLHRVAARTQREVESSKAAAFLQDNTRQLMFGGGAPWIWQGWTAPYQWDAYPGYWFITGDWSDKRDCEVGDFVDYYAVYYYDGTQWVFWYNFWQSFWFGDVSYQDPCLTGGFR